MAIPSTTNWELQQGATAGFLNGNGFDPASTAFITNFTATVATGNAPVIASASYNFVAGDVGAWIYVKSGTNWTPGWYNITSVAANAATVNATIGAAIQIVNGIYKANTVAGCATTASPTAGTCGIDYSQSTGSNLSATDLVIGADNTTITSAGAAFGVQHAGNCLHITAGTNFTTGWYIISTVTAGVAQLDRACGTAASTGGTGRTGGAGSLNALEDAFWEMIMGGNFVWCKFSASVYTISAAIAIASTNSTGTAPSFTVGYNTMRGDEPVGANRPVWAAGANTIAMGQFQNLRKIIITGTASPLLTTGVSSRNVDLKVTNTSSTTNRSAIQSGNSSRLDYCEMISQNGRALAGAGSTADTFGCYAHDSDKGFSITQSNNKIIGCLVESCITNACELTNTGGGCELTNNTFYGSEAKKGIGVDITAAVVTTGFKNNIFYGFVTGINQGTAQQASCMGDYNDFFNNTTDVTNYTKGPHDIAVNPGFVGASQLTGSTATTSGSVLTQSGGDFSTVTDNIDFLRVTSGTGVTVGIYLITGHTGTTLTVNNALGTSSGGDVVWTVPVGHNFAVGTALKALGFPGAYGIETTSYLDMGGIQRQEAGAGTVGHGLTQTVLV